MNFNSKIAKKGGLFWSTGPRMLTWHAYLTWRADVARGTTGGCDVALRPRGSPPMAHAWLTRVRVADTCSRTYHIYYIIYIL